ncbi:hypothetical protein H5410_057882 [Solanum commersonii]|uniref:Disease resistance protein R3a-like protein n=1 Tax=Solanum commersonii TaxID=4109 RepID=A0A9J5WRH8_SOLCO|nr:hypothetical protein H5410_057882 [Solanum commersonii]
MDIGLAVGGGFLSSALNVLFDRLTPQGDLLKMFQKHTNDVRLLKKLRMTLLGLQTVLSEEENKQASNQFVSQWLNELRDAVDSAENFMEQVNYEVLRLKMEGQHQNQQVSDLNLCLSDDFFLNIKEKLEDTIETLKDLQEQIGLLGLKEHFGSTKRETRTPSTSLVDDSDIFGRMNDIENLIDHLLSEDANGKNLTEVPIVGMGGVGKTTLAKAVYNDEKVKNHFGLKAWFCVSEAYDAYRITKGLLQEIGSFDLKVGDNLNQLQVKLKENLKGKKFLVVLDDVWNDNYNEWDDLRDLFVQGDMGSKIIVTTRKENVASMMGSRAVKVGTLSSEVSWDLFKRHSLENRDPEEHPKFEEVGRKIADKCKGLPLALKRLDGILRCKSEVEEWRDILSRKIWDQPSCLNGILPALMLSYNDLPPDLKRCFAYCAIYPKDYLFCKDQVIYLWVANGLVQQFHSGNQYFLELRSRSLFKRVPESEWKPERFLMHDLANDLAQIASSNLCIRLEENKGSHIMEQCRQMSYSIGKNGDFEKLKSLFKSEQLRTLLLIDTDYSPPLTKRVLHNILPRLTSLRSLSLSNSWIVELPDVLFIKLKLLRFLDLSRVLIEKLPDSICVLYNLETLLLSHCSNLKELPLQMEKLINLRHLDVSNTFSLKMLLHLSKLKSLQVLVGAKLLLGGHGGLRMEDLGELHNLYGSLSILELQNVVDRREALKANFWEKNHVDKLSLEWSESTADNSQTERDILDELCPHTNIKELQITGYRGTKFPNWPASLSFLELVKLSIDSLPALGQLPSLKDASNNKDMPEWKQWHVLGSGEFPILENLSIENCPKLIGKLPENLCSLTELSISRCPELNLETPLFNEAELFTSQLKGMKHIVDLSIVGCNSLTSLPFSILPSTLKTITISRCQKLKLDPPVGEMRYCNMFLERLQLHECVSIDDISPELVPRACQLNISSCHNITSFSIPTVTERLFIFGCHNLSVACGGSQMTYLGIIYCEKLTWLPERMQELLPSLKELKLLDCPEIESFPEGGMPFNLQQLRIGNCKKLVNGRKEWRLHRLPCLRKLVIEHDGSDEEIEHLALFKDLSTQLLKSLTFLEDLRIGNLPQIQSMLEEGLPSSLSHLTSLQSLSIFSFHQLQSLSLPSSLSELNIENCPNLQSLSESALPSSLYELTIAHCANLQSLPAKGMLSSLSKLDISNCPFLKPLLEFDKGEYWPEIAHISIIEIDGEYL